TRGFKFQQSKPSRQTGFGPSAVLGGFSDSNAVAGPPLRSAASSHFFSGGLLATAVLFGVSAPLAMASSSGSTRSRIDQFFASRKKTPPPSKNEKAVDGSRNSMEVSPSTKGTLDRYLVKSPDARSPVELLKEQQSPLKSGIVKRNLTLEMNLDSDVHVKPVSPSRSSRDGESSSKAEDQTRIQTGLNFEAFADDNGPNDTYIGEKITETPSEGTENLELRRFANDFLSLYCSELPSAIHVEVDQKLNGQKRNCSPSLVIVNSKLCAKKQCLTAQKDFPTEVNNLPSEGCSQLEGSARRIESEEAVMGHPLELDVYESCRESSMAERESFAGLRKCSNTPTSGSHVGGCYTPASVNVSCSRKTTRSAYRNSIFSPGEEFWNEAIQVADCLFAPIDRPSSLNVFEAEKVQIELDPLKGGRALPPQGTKDIPGIKRSSEAKTLDLAVCLRIKDKDIETVPQHNEASPLPVRHFDFSHEENNFDERHSENRKANIGYVNGKIIERSNVLCYPEATADKLASEEILLKSSTTSVDMNVVPSLAGESPRTSDNILNLKAEECEQMERSYHETPLNDKGGVHDPNLPNIDEETRSHSAVNLKYNDAVSTPSSSMPLKDSLQLSSWLSSELCSVYMKKGISKLYPWQVDCLQVDGVLEKRNLVYCASTRYVCEIFIIPMIHSLLN
ncbi:hypothetical protein Taro_026363, partial [Colocasia esculenta]|nr:hypothetical protein [Colocasia esculenta]